ncbi:MAG: metalloregulator ArsR/SmtB family transcription factor [Devosia sp.]|nr:metalloregulator ArsR/SmtB family transcription factor [Devosia sp.]
MKQIDAMQDEDLANMMRALGHPVRLSILRILADQRQGDCCCTDVTQCLPLAQSTVSQHIKVLLDAGLVERQSRGTRNCYSLRGDRIEALGAASSGLFSDLASDLASRAASVLKEPA